MNTPKIQTLFENKTYAGVRQDKRPPRRSTEKLMQPSTANTSDEYRLKHHGSESRQTSTISSRAPFDIKARILSIAQSQGLTVSEVVLALIKKALQLESDLQYGALLEPVIRKTIVSQMQGDTNRVAYLSSRSFYSAEETRLLVLRLLSLVLIDKPHLYEQYLEDAKKQARLNLARQNENRQGE